jgi:hypothetical protein
MNDPRLCEQRSSRAVSRAVCKVTMDISPPSRPAHVYTGHPSLQRSSEKPRAPIQFVTYWVTKWIGPYAVFGLKIRYPDRLFCPVHERDPRATPSGPHQQVTFLPSLPKCFMRSSAVVFVIPSGA